MPVAWTLSDVLKDLRTAGSSATKEDGLMGHVLPGIVRHIGEFIHLNEHRTKIKGLVFISITEETDC